MTRAKAKVEQRRVVIVDDHPIVRQGLTELIGCQEDLTVCGEAPDAPTALEVVEKTDPDLVVVDISLKDSSGIDLIRDLKIRKPNLVTLVLSMHDESFYAERVLRAGARGYVTKDEASDTLIAAIRKALSGEIYLSEKMASRMLSKFVDGPPETGPTAIERLSDREFQVFELIGRGMTMRRIAAQLHLSTKTIESHRENIKRKLKLEGATEVLQHAIQWVQLEQMT
jgi:DNA-binding NarL/FixJ family response regulator